MKFAISEDGTRIAYDSRGSGAVARAINEAVPRLQFRTLAGQTPGVKLAILAPIPTILAPILEEFFVSTKDAPPPKSPDPERVVEAAS